MMAKDRHEATRNKQRRVHADESSLLGLACANCSSPEESPRRRTFSEQAWAALLLWNEIKIEAIDNPVCDTCYQELRDILIDRSDEIDEAKGENEVVSTVRKRLSSLAG